MTLAKNYNPQTVEPELERMWTEEGVYYFQRESEAPVYAIDTPPPSVSGHLHLGHLFSYTHADFFARYRRMRGYNVFYPMGYDDNGLPTERLVERETGMRAVEVGRQEFIRQCLAISETAEQQYEALWRRLGLSVDWRYTYRTIDDESRRVAQWGFLDLMRKGLAYRQQSPTIWCPECRTAISQAELNDHERETTFYTLQFAIESGHLAIATTRPELLPACVAVFVHPDDSRYHHLIGQLAAVPMTNRSVPILADAAAEPTKGTGAVMCCTFGDTNDIAWWRAHELPLIEAIGRDGCMTAAAGAYSGLTTTAARERIIDDLGKGGFIRSAQLTDQSVRVHERCDTPAEYITSRQWFIRVLDRKAEWLDAGERIVWYPEHMKSRYRQWVENLSWDWCISRQRFFGVPFPLWYCANCGEPLPADESALPIDPLVDHPARPCACGGTEVRPETDVMDTWATSSLSPQLVGRMMAEPPLFQQVFPMTLRPQAHEIIRTWAFYTIVRSLYHTGQLPWREVAISGWGLAADGEEKLSKSRGGGSLSPVETMELYSADAVRYWAAGTALGKDTVISEKRMEAGGKLVTKLWNVARFSERFIINHSPLPIAPADLKATDRWLLARLNGLIISVTAAFDQYDYAMARNELDAFFWHDLADNYLELVKKRLYDGTEGFGAACYTLHTALLTTVKLLAPLLPYVTETIYQALFSRDEAGHSIHRAAWPEPDNRFIDPEALAGGAVLLDIASAVRRYKSERNLSVGAELHELQVSLSDPSLAGAVQDAEIDLISVSRARSVNLVLSTATEDGWTKEGSASIRVID